MRQYGKITKYNGQFGNIIDDKGDEYILLKQNTLDDFELKKDDYVAFASEIKKIDEEIGELKIATLVRKLDYNANKNLK